MVKTITTIYLNADILKEAKAQRLNISLLCEEALKETIKGSGLGEALNIKAECSESATKTAKDNAILRNSFKKMHERVLTEGGYLRMLRAYCIKYKISKEEAHNIAQGLEEAQGGV